MSTHYMRVYARVAFCPISPFHKSASEHLIGSIIKNLRRTSQDGGTCWSEDNHTGRCKVCVQTEDRTETTVPAGIAVSERQRGYQMLAI